MRRFHIVLGSATDVAATSRDVQQGLRPRHFMLELAARLDGALYEPDATTAAPALFHRIINTPPALVALADRVVAACQDEDAIFCNAETIALPVAHALLRAGKQTRLASFGHNLYRPRIALTKTLSRSYRRVNRWFIISKDQCREPSRQSLYLEQVDDLFFSPAPADAVPAAARPLIVSVGLEQRDYVTLAEATRDMDVDVRISGASKDARTLPGTFPEVMPANMSRQFYSWPDLRDLYRAADLVVVPVRQNAYAAGITSILEALATGKPVIASRTSGLEGTLADDTVIRWVTPADPAELRNQIQTLLADPAGRRALAEKGAAMFRAHHRKNLRLDYMQAQMRAL